MPVAGRRQLRLAFSDPQSFENEYERNMREGGAFVATSDSFELREIVEVDLVLPFLGRTLTLDAEVVHAPPGGVAVQFLEGGPELRERLAPLLDACRRSAGTPAPRPPERRDSPRSTARVPVQVKAPTGFDLEGRTRNLSRSGALVSLDGSALPVGRKVRVALLDPETGAPLEVEGQVVRHLEGEGTVPAVAIHFEPPEEQQAEVAKLLEDLQENDRRLQRDGIRGPVEDMGVAALLQMFASYSSRGTLTVTHGTEEGTLAFEDGELVLVRLGTVSGVKALTRMFRWRGGEFEFRAHVDPVPESEKALPLEAAVLEALRRLDEEQRLNLPELPSDAYLALERERLGATAEALTQTEEAVLDLAAAGFTVRRILDVIPEDDARIRTAIDSLCQRGVASVVARK